MAKHTNTKKKFTKGHKSPNYSQIVEENRRLRSQIVNEKYESAQSYLANAAHWLKADRLSPDAASSPSVRATLRSRSRFECIENNPFLKGTISTVCNDFSGNGVRINVLDDSISEQERLVIERRWDEWCLAIKMRDILWRSCMAKIVDGEAFAMETFDPHLNHPVQMKIQLFEPECVVSPIDTAQDNRIYDGIRFDSNNNPTAYYILYEHPGGGFFQQSKPGEGRWVDSERIRHWFRRDRGWHRAIPEMASSLPLCAVLRRYTMAELKKQEVNASYTVFFESQMPTFAPQGQAKPPKFDPIPISPGTGVALPYGMSAKEFGRTVSGQEYDSFVGSILREIIRPLEVPFNIAIGTSKDSNMASAVVDAHLYKSSQETRRQSCEEDFLYPTYYDWFKMGCLTRGYFSPRGRFASDNLMENPPLVRFYWKKVGLDHTDPYKVAQAKVLLRNAGILLDEDIQQEDYDRDLTVWQEKAKKEAQFRRENLNITEEDNTSSKDNEEN